MSELISGRAEPIARHDRMAILDIVRGFALLGILLMNIEYFQRPMQAIMLGFNADQSGLDYAVAWFSYAFIQGKFYTMFSLLFGFGFVVFLDRAIQRVSRPKLLFVRRLFILSLFGVAHAFFIWSGDILLVYAVIGVLLLFWSQSTVKTLRRWGIALLLFPPILFWLLAIGLNLGLQSPAGPDILAGFEQEQAQLQADIARGELLYSQGSWKSLVAWRAHELVALYGGGGFLFFLPNILGMFLIGAAFARSGVLADLDASAAFFKKILIVGALVGIPSALYVGLNAATLNMMFPTYDSALIMTAVLFANLGLCLAYIAALTLLVRAGNRWLSYLAPMGRMALTNYLLHSIVFTTLFYGYGFGLYGEFGRAATTVMALALFGLQIVGSHWWMKQYRFGPCEWLWRTLTYGKLQPMRIAQS